MPRSSFLKQTKSSLKETLLSREEETVSHVTPETRLYYRLCHPLFSRPSFSPFLPRHGVSASRTSASVLPRFQTDSHVAHTCADRVSGDPLLSETRSRIPFVEDTCQRKERRRGLDSRRIFLCHGDGDGDDGDSKRRFCPWVGPGFRERYASSISRHCWWLHNTVSDAVSAVSETVTCRPKPLCAHSS